MNSCPIWFIVCPGVKSGDGHLLTAVNILNGVQNFDAFRQGHLECLAAGNQPYASVMTAMRTASARGGRKRRYPKLLWLCVQLYY